MTGLQLEHALEHGLWRHHRPKGEGLVEPQRVELAGQLGGTRKQRLDLAGKEHAPLVQSEVQRAHADSVAAQHEGLALGVPQGDGPLAVHLLEGGLTPGFPGVNDDLGIAVGPKTMAQLFELFAQLDVIEDFAVERHPHGAVFVRQRLLAGR